MVEDKGFKEEEICKVEPFFDKEKKRKVSVRAVEYPWEMGGKSGVSDQIVVVVAKVDGEGEVRFKKGKDGKAVLDPIGNPVKHQGRIGIPLELVDRTVQAIQESAKKLKEKVGSNEMSSE